jgi:protein phosphatase
MQDTTETLLDPNPEGRQDRAVARPKRSVQVEFGALSHIGKVRQKNEDHYLICRIARALSVLHTNLPDGELPEQVEQVAYGMVVADGMGGMTGGEQASLLAIRTGVKLVLESPRWALRIDDQEARQLIERMKTYFEKVDATLIAQSKVDPSLTGMGTTLTVAYSVGADVFIVHAGDSRAYRFHDGKLHQLTRDHTLGRARHVLTNFAGGPTSGIVPEISTAELADGDRLMLCSDGLTSMVDDGEVADILRRTSAPAQAAEALVARALERGGRDNVTVLVAGYAIAD